jgi:hypothetical protein
VHTHPHIDQHPLKKKIISKIAELRWFSGFPVYLAQNSLSSLLLPIQHHQEQHSQINNDSDMSLMH